MAWTSIIGQQRIKRILQQTIREGRIAHAYCFYGPEGIGKDALAIEFAKAVSCLTPRMTEPFGIDACDECISCKQIQTLSHPNVQFVFSLPAAKSGTDSKNDSPLLKLSDEQIALIREQIAEKATNPYHNIDIPNATQIRIAAIRELKKKISMSANQPGRRFVIISEADTMNPEAANAFLKSLEEPASGITIILTTSRKEQLLPTILSRCQQVRCDLLDDLAIAEALQQRHNFSAEQARLTSRLADGSYSKSLEVAQTDVQELRADIVALMRAILRRRTPGYMLKLHHEIEKISASGNKLQVEKTLNLLLLWLRDAAVLAWSNASAEVVNIDQLTELQNFAKNFPHALYTNAVAAVEQALEDIRRNVHLQLVLITLALSLRESLAPAKAE